MAEREATVARLYNEGWRAADFDVVFGLVDPVEVNEFATRDDALAAVSGGGQEVE